MITMFFSFFVRKYWLLYCKCLVVDS